MTMSHSRDRLGDVIRRLRVRMPVLLLAAVSTLGACVRSTPTTHSDLDPPMYSPASSCDADLAAPLPFERSPGGVPEVDPQWVHEHGCQVRLVDVREPEELAGPLGVLEGIEHVPLRELDRRAASWDPATPVVLVCRSGRRSARGVALLEAQGFEHVASMTGGLQRWVAEDRPVSRHSDRPSAPLASPRSGAGQPLTIDDVERHLGTPEQVRWVKTAALLLQGVESCVDGRDRHPVIGTLGGDAGEMLLGLATVEQLTERPFTPSEVDALLDAHLEAFGRFYLHTDEHALMALGETLQSDPRWAEHRDELDDIDGLMALLLHPPRALERALIEHLTEPSHVGCGHLRLVLEHPSEYGVRPELTRALLRAFFRRRFAGDPRLDYVVLHGEHHEGAVLQIVLPHDVQPYTKVPAIAPMHASGTTLFVSHPQLSAYLRVQNANWIVEQLASSGIADDRPRVEASGLVPAQQQLAEQQLGATLSHLARGLPIYEATPLDGSWAVSSRGRVP